MPGERIGGTHPSHFGTPIAAMIKHPKLFAYPRFWRRLDTGRMAMRLIIALAGAAALAACTTYGSHGGAGYGPYGGYRYDGNSWAGRHGGGALRGPGVELLDPWLAETEEGQAMLRAGWRSARSGWVDEEVAVRANRWFRRYADANRDYCLTDDEIRQALVWALRTSRYAQR
jgi:hypothetical protein